MFRRTIATAFAVLAATPLVASAQFSAFTDRGVFASALSISGTDTFDDMKVGFQAPGPRARTAGVFGYTASSSGVGPLYVGATPSPALSVDFSFEGLVFDGFGPTVNAWGANVFLAFQGSLRTGTLSVTALDVLGATTTQLFTDVGYDNFFGVISGAQLQRITIAPVSGGDLVFVYADDNTLGVAAVPEPSTYVLMLAGVGALVLVHRSRQET